MRVTEIIADLHVTDLEAAKGFYTDYLGLTAEEFNLGWVARYTSPKSGINIQLMTRNATAATPAPASWSSSATATPASSTQTADYSANSPSTQPGTTSLQAQP